MAQRPRRRPTETPSEKNAIATLTVTNPYSNADSQDIDPDPYLLVTAVAAAVAAVAQVVHLAHAMWPRKPTRLSDAGRAWIEKLEDDLHETIREVEKIERFLRAVNSIEGRAVLDAPTRFGAAPMALSSQDLIVYDRMVEFMSLRIGGLNKLTLGVIRYDPDFATLLGADILSSFSDIQDRINGMRDTTNGEALLDALAIMREIERILVRLRQHN